MLERTVALLVNVVASGFRHMRLCCFFCCFVFVFLSLFFVVAFPANLFSAMRSFFAPGRAAPKG